MVRNILTEHVEFNFDSVKLELTLSGIQDVRDYPHERAS